MVSVIIPVLNCEKYIDTCIASVLGQTYQDFELLLMVGISKDRSLDKCIEWQKKDERIVIVSRKDTSLGDARNYAMHIAKGQYIAFIDADDFIDKNFLLYMVTPLEENKDIDFSCCGYKNYKGKNDVDEFLPVADGVSDIDFEEYFSLNVFVTVWCKVYRKKFLVYNNITMFDGMCEDESYTFILAAVAKKVYVVRNALYFYNIGNSESLIRAHNYKARLDYLKSMEFAIKYMKENDIYKQNRKVMMTRVCKAMQSFLYEHNFRPEMVSEYKRFIADNFEEFAGVMRFTQKKIGDNRFIMFGAGKDAMNFIRFKPKGVEVSYMVDSNKENVGKSIEGIMVCSIDRLKDEDRGVAILVSSRKYRFDIAKKLDSVGFYNLYYLEDLLSLEQLRNSI